MMYTKALIIVLIAASATARPTDEDDDNHHEDHDHADVRQVADECFKLTGYSEDSLYERIENTNLSFCDQEAGKAWMTCFYQKTDAMDEDYVLNVEHLREDFVHHEEKLKVFHECIDEANNQDNDEKACTLHHCVHAKILSADEEDEFHELNEEKHNHEK